MRGLAVVIMIQCHVFNSFTRLDLRGGGVYLLTQFVGGMAAPLFLFMAGMTSGFQMDRLERKSLTRAGRWLAALRRAGYIGMIAYLFRSTNWLGTLPKPNNQDFWKVDILNCMALAMLIFSVAAIFDYAWRMRAVLAGALLVAGGAPLMSGLDWSGVPRVMMYYLVPGPDHGQFPLFPCAAYLGFGIAAGSLVKRAASLGGGNTMDCLMRWLAPAGLALILASKFAADLPFSIYQHANFWRNSPALILIRVGTMLLMLVGSYVWTEFCASPGWSWMESLGKTSLLVYWVHVTMVYGGIALPLKRSLTQAGSAVAVIVVTLMMIALAEARLQHKARRVLRWKAATTVAGAAGA
jgi:uncharacterized membrane protein